MTRFERDKHTDDAGSTIVDAELPAGSMPFAKATADAVATVRGALGALVADLPGVIRRPRELQKALGVDYKICWQVFNVIKADDPLTAAKHTPSPLAMRRFLASGLKAGIAKRRVEAVESAIERFSNVVNTHAEDRSTFDSMVAAVAADDGDVIDDLQQRRAAYRSMSHIWGAQIESHLSASWVRRSKDKPGVLDECLVTLKRGFCRLRPSAQPIVNGARRISGADDNVGQIPLEPAVARRHRAPLLPEFCSKPLPKLETKEGGGGWLYTKLATAGIGRQSTVDLAFGLRFVNVPLVVDDQTGQGHARGSLSIRTPTALLVFDYMIHRPSFGVVTPQMFAFQSMPGDELPDVSRLAPRLQLREKPVNLGNAAYAMAVPEWPRYNEMLQYSANRLKWDLSEFDVWRLRLEYPVFGSVVRMQFAVE